MFGLPSWVFGTSKWYKKWTAEKTGDMWHRNEFRQTKLLCLQEERDYTKQAENNEYAALSIARASCYHEAYHFRYSTVEQVPTVSSILTLGKPCIRFRSYLTWHSSSVWATILAWWRGLRSPKQLSQLGRGGKLLVGSPKVDRWLGKHHIKSSHCGGWAWG